MSTPVGLQRKPFWAPIGVAGVFALGAAFVLALLGWLLVTAVTSRPTTIILVREAQSTADAPLGVDGQARADALAHMLGDAGSNGQIDRIYVLPEAASLATARPLVTSLGLHPMDAESGPNWARRLLHEHRGERVLVVTQAGAAREAALELSGVDQLAPITPTQLGVMYIVTIPRLGRANLLRVDY